MSHEECRVLLRSRASIVAVEAAAGCGKTFEAALLAVDLAKDLEPGREILLLAHTHVAVGVFKQRVKQSRVRVMTLDSFARELVEPYAAALALPFPLQLGRRDGLSFDKLAPAAGELLRRAPALRAAIARHYPFILMDEHQDARQDQHDIARQLAAAGARVRFFGDPMQGIFDFGKQPAADWSSLTQCATDLAQLTTPRRWPDAPELGQWLVAARAELQGGRGLPELVSQVRIVPVEGLVDPQPNSDRPPRSLAKALFGVLNRLRGSVALLVRSNDQAVGLRRALQRSVRIFEGRSALERAGGLLDEALPLSGNRRALALLAVEVLAQCSVGLDAAKRRQVTACLHEDGVARGRHTKLLPLLARLEEVYVAPTVASWCRVLGQFAQQPVYPLRLDAPGALIALGHLRASRDDALHDALGQLGHSRVRRTIVGRRIMTVHAAKGDEFDHVVVPYFGARSFRDRPSDRRVLYVAASRARCSLTFLCPSDAPSPLAPERASGPAGG